MLITLLGLYVIKVSTYIYVSKRWKSFRTVHFRSLLFRPFWAELKCIFLKIAIRGVAGTECFPTAVPFWL